MIKKITAVLAFAVLGFVGCSGESENNTFDVQPVTLSKIQGTYLVKDIKKSEPAFLNGVNDPKELTIKFVVEKKECPTTCVESKLELYLDDNKISPLVVNPLGGSKVNITFRIDDFSCKVTNEYNQSTLSVSCLSNEPDVKVIEFVAEKQN